MQESDIINQITQMMGVTLQGIGVVFSIVSAYVVALYYFLYRAPMILRLGAFLFFSLISVILFVFTKGAFEHGAALIQGLQDIAATQHHLSAVGQAALERGGALTSDWLSVSSVDADLRLVITASLALVYVTLFYLTFFHRWTHADYTERD